MEFPMVVALMLDGVREPGRVGFHLTTAARGSEPQVTATTPPMLPRVEAVDKRDCGLGPYNHEVMENPERMGLRAARLPHVRMQSRSAVNERMPRVVPCLGSE
ncbi:hypothetical protein R1flu_026417 [Riccia fluitans]|uniref:Uncharacterized protein n=1 Tax=Riccia fluitans TaxID=41844 RepID=A0ABD1XGH7_9MARC